MKIKRFQFWRNIIYGNKKIPYWSQKVRGRGDRNLLSDSPRRGWKKIIVLKPIGSSDTVFSMGFCDIHGNTRISSSKRKIRDGEFGMRMGPDDCDFFIASHNGNVELHFSGYVDIKAKIDTILY